MTSTFLPYGRQIIDKDDINAVVQTLTSDWLTTGPAVERFETDVCTFTQATHGVALATGTAGLHAALHALNIGPGDEVIVPPLTFVASANCILYQGATPVFVDVDPKTLLIDPDAVAAAITPKTKTIIGVDYAGLACDWNRLKLIAEKHSIALVADSCHALGALYHGKPVGTLADISVLSFHPVKHITTGEGGMCLTHSAELAAKMRTFRSHGITSTASQREKSGTWYYEMVDLGFNYRISDIQCALGSSQLKKLPAWLKQRRELAAFYDKSFSKSSHIRPLDSRDDSLHAYHLYVVRVPNRDHVFQHLRAAGIGANVHYFPVHLHPYYQSLGYTEGLCPHAERAAAEILTLPLWAGMDEDDCQRVITALNTAIEA